MKVYSTSFGGAIKVDLLSGPTNDWRYSSRSSAVFSGLKIKLTRVRKRRRSLLLRRLDAVAK